MHFMVPAWTEGRTAEIPQRGLFLQYYATSEKYYCQKFLLSGFLTQAGKKALLRGSWYAQRTPGGSLILKVFLTSFADPTGLHTLLKAYANCPEPLTLCLLATVDLYF